MKDLKQVYDSHLSLLGAAPGVGKIEFAINLMEELALKENKSILFFGFDGPPTWYTQKFLSIMLKVSERGIKKYIEPLKKSGEYDITKIDKEKFIKALDTLYKSAIYMQNTKEYFPSGILEYMKYFKKENPLNLLVIDNLEILKKIYHCKNEIELEQVLIKFEKFSYKEKIPILILTTLDYKKSSPIKLNLLDNFKYSENILSYFKTISILELEELTLKDTVEENLYIIKDDKITKRKIKYNRNTKKMVEIIKKGEK